MNDNSEDLLQNPPLPPWRYEGAEEVKTPVSKKEANTGEVSECVCVCVCVCVSIDYCS